MHENQFDVVAFDLDGTLADTAPDIAAALNHVLRAFGRPIIPEEGVRDLIGHGARALISKAFLATGGASEEQLDEGLALFLAYYGAHLCEGTRPYPGVERALETLRQGGTRLAICTNKPEGLARQLVEALGWTGLFDAIIGGDTLPVRKPDPAPLREAIARVGGGRAIFVGDSVTDADTARAAGIPLILVSFGFSDRPVAELGADGLIDDYRELIPALSRACPA